jgi:ribosomal protein S18 acetylase RimI-like enzyme
MVEVIIRPMVDDDREDVMRIVRDSAEFNRLDCETAAEVIDDYLDNPVEAGYFVTVAEIEDGVVGYVAYGLTPLTVGTWDIYWIAVDPEMKGQGIGTMLMEDAEKEITGAGGYLILIETSGKVEYENTRGFYEGRGYSVASTIRDFYSPGDDLVTFEKRFG